VTASADADRVGVHELGVRDASAHLGKGGIQVAAGAVDYTNTRVDDARAERRNADTGANGHAAVGGLAVHELGVRDGRFSGDRDGLSAAASRVDYAAVRARGVSVGQRNDKTGNGVSAGVDQAVLGAVSARDASASVDPRALRANASVRDASVTAYDLQGARAGVEVGGREVLGGRADLHQGHRVAAADAAIDLRRGSASASVEGYRHTRSMKNAQVNILGTQVAIPDVVLELAASGGASVDLKKGAASLEVNLAGSQIAIGDAKITLPAFVQAGVDMDLSKGNLDLNIGGHEIDVDEAIGRWARQLKGLFGDGERQAPAPARVEAGRKAVEGLAAGVVTTRDQLRKAVADER